LKKITLVILFLSQWISAQDYVQIPTGATIQIKWIAPADTDVVEYRAYWMDLNSTINSVTVINEWYTNNAPQDSTDSMYLYEHHLPLGRGMVEMTAKDRSGNESDRSNAVYYDIVDEKPGAPSMVIIRISR